MNKKATAALHTAKNSRINEHFAGHDLDQKEMDNDDGNHRKKS